ncbi:MAG: hypothetical protein ACR2G8_09725 [Candidatus Limnocylindria bacterium]
MITSPQCADRGRRSVEAGDCDGDAADAAGALLLKAGGMLVGDGAPLT